MYSIWSCAGALVSSPGMIIDSGFGFGSHRARGGSIGGSWLAALIAEERKERVLLIVEGSDSRRVSHVIVALPKLTTFVSKWPTTLLGPKAPPCPQSAFLALEIEESEYHNVLCASSSHS